MIRMKGLEEWGLDKETERVKSWQLAGRSLVDENWKCNGYALRRLKPVNVDTIKIRRASSPLKIGGLQEIEKLKFCVKYTRT